MCTIKLAVLSPAMRVLTVCVLCNYSTSHQFMPSCCYCLFVRVRSFVCVRNAGICVYVAYIHCLHVVRRYIYEHVYILYSLLLAFLNNEATLLMGRQGLSPRRAFAGAAALAAHPGQRGARELAFCCRAVVLNRHLDPLQCCSIWDGLFLLATSTLGNYLQWLPSAELS